MLVSVLSVIFFGNKNKSPAVAEDTSVITGQANYLCSGNHKVEAVFIEKGTRPEVVVGEPPVSNASVQLNFDGADNIVLHQAISADGSRYSNEDESLVFWSKGSGAMVMENGKETTFRNCIQIKADKDNLPQVYLDDVNNFTLRYPADYTFDNSYTYQNLGPEISIRGVKFQIPEELSNDTNLSKDSYISVERRNGTQSCSAKDFLTLAPEIKSNIVEDGDFTYSFATSSDAGAGNRYEEYIYALADHNPCLAVRYFIHYSAIENYDKGTVTEFDKSALIKQFDLIRKSMTLDFKVVPVSVLNSDAYPLYEGLIWDVEKEDMFGEMRGVSIKSKPLSNVVDISSISLPFEKYYKNLLESKGWKEDINMSAGGAGSSITVYKKGDEYIVLKYESDFSVNNKDQPSQCPCALQFTIFSGI